MIKILTKQNILKLIKLTFLIVFVSTLIFLFYSNFILSNKLKSISYINNIPTTQINNFSATTTQIISSLSEAEKEKNKKIEETKEKLIGCFYSKDNINERIKLDRYGNFAKFIEGSLRFVQTGGTYILNDEKTLFFTPQEESKFSMFTDMNQGSINILEVSGKIFEKGLCADFYPAY